MIFRSGARSCSYGVNKNQCPELLVTYSVQIRNPNNSILGSQAFVYLRVSVDDALESIPIARRFFIAVDTLLAVAKRSDV